MGRALMIGVDRLDYSKGLVERFKAYQRFLETYPENQSRVTFLQIAPLSRTDVRAYAEIRQLARAGRGPHQGRVRRYRLDADPLPEPQLSARRADGLHARAQVGIVTPLRDGMNLVAKEFVAAQDPDDPGVLILSTLAGAARELIGGAAGESVRHARSATRSRRRCRCHCTSGASGTSDAAGSQAERYRDLDARRFVEALEHSQPPENARARRPNH